MSQHPAPVSRGPEASGAAMLSIGTVASGVLAYAFNVLAARALGPEDYGPVALLWATVFLVSVVLFRPVEQTLSRGIADRLARGGDPQPVVRAAGRVAGTVAGTAVAVCLLAWTPITNGLFDGHAALTAALIAGIAGYGVSFFARGLMGGLRWFGGYGMLLLADGAVRIALALPLALVASPAIAGVAVAGAALGGALAPLAGSGRARAQRLHADGDGEPFPVRNALRFAGPVTVIAAADQLLVSGGPLLVVLAGGPGATAAAGTVFAATMLVRAPVFLFQGFAAALLPSLTALQAVGDAARLRRAVLRAAGALGLFALALTVAALAGGPLGMHILYGPGFDVERLDLAILAAGVGGYLIASAFSQAALARGEAGRAAAIWTLSAATFVISELAAVSGSPLHRVSVAFALAALVNTVLFAVLVMRREAAPREAALALG